MASTTKYPSIGMSAGLVQNAERKYGIALERDETRRIEHSIGCTFTPRSGRTWMSCSDAAEYVKVVYRKDDGTPVFGQYPERRCAKHKALDERTARNARYTRTLDYEPFHAVLTANQMVEDIKARRDALRLDAIYQKAFASAQYLLDHVDLTEDQSRAIRKVIKDGYAGTVK